MDFERVQPEGVGMSASRLVRAKEYAQQVGEQLLESSGGAVLVLRHNKVAGEWYWGKRGPSPEDLPYDENTLTPV